MRIVLWVGNEANQKALANKIHQKFPLTAIVLETKKIRNKITIGKLIDKALEKLFLAKIGKAWFGMLDYYRKKYPSYPDVPLLNTENINSDDAYEFSRKYEPDLVIVSGTRLIKNKLLSVSRTVGIMNLHT